MRRVAIWFGPLNINDTHSIHYDLRLAIGEVNPVEQWLARPRNKEIPALPRRQRRSEARRRRRRWWRNRSFKNVLSNVALPVVDVPVGVADVVVPNYWIHTEVAGLHRGIPWAPATGPGWVVFWAAGPGFQRYGSG
jgi:hypothetical protein